MISKLRPLAVALAVSLASGAIAGPVEEAALIAQNAADELRDAIAQIDTALDADDQVVALTEVIRAYEHGLAALREGLRQAASRESEIRIGFEAQRDTLSRILGVMITMQRSPEATLLLHPSGATASARSGMVMTSLTPALQAKAEVLRAQLDEISKVRALQEAAANALAQGLGQVQDARRLLASASRDRTTLPDRYGEDPAELRRLLDTARTLDEFADGIVNLEDDIGAPMADFEGAQGSLPMPAMGDILRGYNEADAAGVKRPGIVISTAPSALVSTPWPATIRYRGPLLDQGQVMIVEPAPGYMLVLTGMAQVFGEVGDVLAAGDPVGLMGGNEPSAKEFGIEFVRDAAIGGGAGRTETLYVELRQGQATLNPANWFVLNPIVAAAAPTAEVE